ncbi:MAG TPA: AMP-binding protein, partial [Pseudomonadales bacterium]|nr:AMP-binding protein [Pseudomonadales bacterium]
MASVGFWKIAQEAPDRTAIISAQGVKISFGQLYERVNKISHGLRALGLKKGGAVAMVMSNTPEYLEVFLATQQIGVYITPINYHLTGPEIAYILDNCGAEVFVVGEKYADACIKAVNE